MTTHNSKQVKKTLKLLLSILDEHKAEYRVLGSVVTAAIIGKQHRKLGDIDLILDSKHKSSITAKLKGLGYGERKNFFLSVGKYLNLDSLDHHELLEIGIFWGTWDEGNFIIGSKNNGATINRKALIPTNYKLHNLSFIGLPKEVIARGLHMSKNNPKRKVALKKFNQLKIVPMRDEYIHINLFGVKVDFIYRITMLLLNVIGFVRLKLGKPFDPWR